MRHAVRNRRLALCLLTGLLLVGCGGGGTGDTIGGGNGTACGACSTEKQHNLDRINTFRTGLGLAAITLDTGLLGDYAQTGCQQYAAGGPAHGHFLANPYPPGYAGPRAENQGFANGFGSNNGNIDRVIDLFIAEGPGGGHYDNMANPAWTTVGVGIVVDGSGTCWLTQDFH